MKTTKLYKITNKKTKEYYIGITYKTIGVDYFTSSKSVNFTPENKDEWIIEILNESVDRDLIWREEQKLIENNISNILNLNKHYRTEEGMSWDTSAECGKARWNNPEYRQKTVDGLNKAWQDPAKKAERVAIIQTKLQSPEMAKIRSEFMTERNKDPEVRKKQSETMKKLYGPGSKQREIISKAVKERYKDPEERKKVSERMKAKWADPEYRKIMSAKVGRKKKTS